MVIRKRNTSNTGIKPIDARPDKKRPIGLAGKEYPDFQIGVTFFEPLPDEMISSFDGKKSCYPTKHAEVEEVFCKLHKTGRKAVTIDEINDAPRKKVKNTFRKPSK